MLDEKDYESANGRLIGPKFADLRRQRASLMIQLVATNDVSLKPKISALTAEIFKHLVKGN